MQLTRDDAQPVFEYACHEGNEGIQGILRAARAPKDEAAAASRGVTVPHEEVLLQAHRAAHRVAARCAWLTRSSREGALRAAENGVGRSRICTGIWPSTDMVGVPFERPANLGERTEVTAGGVRRATEAAATRVGGRRRDRRCRRRCASGRRHRTAVALARVGQGLEAGVAHRRAGSTAVCRRRRRRRSAAPRR